jgi:hypothetical protein
MWISTGFDGIFVDTTTPAAKLVSFMGSWRSVSLLALIKYETANSLRPSDAELCQLLPPSSAESDSHRSGRRHLMVVRLLTEAKSLQV